MPKQTRPRLGNLGAKLKQIREHLKLTQTEMYRLVAPDSDALVNRAVISQYERSERSPSLHEIILYAKSANVSIDALLDDDAPLRFTASAVESPGNATHDSQIDAAAIEATDAVAAAAAIASLPAPADAAAHHYCEDQQLAIQSLEKHERTIKRLPPNAAPRPETQYSLILRKIMHDAARRKWSPKKFLGAPLPPDYRTIANSAYTWLFANNADTNAAAAASLTVTITAAQNIQKSGSKLPWAWLADATEDDIERLVARQIQEHIEWVFLRITDPDEPEPQAPPLFDVYGDPGDNRETLRERGRQYYFAKRERQRNARRCLQVFDPE